MHRYTKEYSLIGKAGSFNLLIFSSSLNTLVYLYEFIKGIIKNETNKNSKKFKYTQVP